MNEHGGWLRKKEYSHLTRIIHAILSCYVILRRLSADSSFAVPFREYLDQNWNAMERSTIF